MIEENLRNVSATVAEAIIDPNNRDKANAAIDTLIGFRPGLKPFAVLGICADAFDAVLIQCGAQNNKARVAIAFGIVYACLSV